MKQLTEQRADLEVNALRERNTVTLARGLLGKYLVGIPATARIRTNTTYCPDGSR